MRRTAQDSFQRLSRARRKPLRGLSVGVRMAACLVAISMVSGCGGSNHSQPAAGGTVPPGQALSTDLQQVLSEVAQLRGLPVPEGLSAASLTRAQIPSLLDQELTADDRQYMSDQTVLYQLLGLLNAQQDY